MSGIKKVGQTVIQSQHKATCHCGQVELLLDLPDGLINPRRCDCSMCDKRGAIAVSVPLDGLHIIKGEALLTLYQFNTMSAKHYFCSVCGIYTHHQRRSDPTQYGVNVACLDGITAADLVRDGVDIPIMDGQHHPKDR